MLNMILQQDSNKFVHKGYQAVKAVPFDMPIVGYNNKIVNTLRIWDAEPIVDFELDSFDKGDYKKAVEQENLARNIVEFFTRTITTWQVKNCV